MYESNFSLSTEFPVLIDTDIEFGRINSLSYQLKAGMRDGLLCGEFVSGGFRFTDLNNNLIYRLLGADRFSTLLIDGERVLLDKDTNGLKDIGLRIKVPTEYTESSIPKPIDEMGLFSAPVSILGVTIDVSLSSLHIGEYYSFKAKNILFLAKHRNSCFRFSLR